MLTLYSPTLAGNALNINHLPTLKHIKPRLSIAPYNVHFPRVGEVFRVQKQLTPRGASPIAVGVPKRRLTFCCASTTLRGCGSVAELMFASKRTICPINKSSMRLRDREHRDAKNQRVEINSKMTQCGFNYNLIKIMTPRAHITGSRGRTVVRYETFHQFRKQQKRRFTEVEGNIIKLAAVCGKRFDRRRTKYASRPCRCTAGIVFCRQLVPAAVAAASVVSASTVISYDFRRRLAKRDELFGGGVMVARKLCGVDDKERQTQTESQSSSLANFP